MGVTLREARTDADIDAVRTLCWAYRDFLRNYGPEQKLITDTFYPTHKYAALMERLVHEHARPTGIMLLARQDDMPIGCGMTHPLGPDASEIKRVYVRDAARGSGAGRALCVALIEQARADGFKTLYLDTAKAFAPARKLYRSLGFVERGPYQPVPEIARDAICFYELTL